jgi:hypothetical protein
MALMHGVGAVWCMALLLFVCSDGFQGLQEQVVSFVQQTRLH